MQHPEHDLLHCFSGVYRLQICTYVKFSHKLILANTHSMDSVETAKHIVHVVIVVNTETGTDSFKTYQL